MTDILTALKECAENENIVLTRGECKRALIFIAHLQRKIIANALMSYDQETELKKDSPTVNAIKWAGRWITLVLSFIGLFVMFTTWQSSPLYYLCGLTLATFYSHAIWMTFEWWHK